MHMPRMLSGGNFSVSGMCPVMHIPSFLSTSLAIETVRKTVLKVYLSDVAVV